MKTNKNVVLSRRAVYPVIEDFFDGVLKEVDHAIEKYPSDNATRTSLSDSRQVLVREVQEVLSDIDTLASYGGSTENLRTELLQVAGVCLMMYSRLDDRRG